MADKRNNDSWNVDDIDFEDIDFDDIDLEDLDFSVDGELNSINEGIKKDQVLDDLAAITGDKNVRENVSRPVRKVETKRFDDVEEEDDDDYDEFEERRHSRKSRSEKPAKASGTDRPAKGGKKTGSKAPLIIVICLIAGLVIGALLFFLVKTLSSDDTSATTTAGTASAGQSGDNVATTAAWSMNTEEGVLDLVNNYYVALTLADVDALRNILDAAVEINEEKVQAEAKVVEGYQNIAAYTSPGRADGEFVTYISFEMKFKNINTTAPGLVPAYVKTAADGTLKLLTWDYISANDKDLASFMASAANCDAIANLAKEVDTAFQNAKATDETLAEFLNSLSPSTTAAPEGSTADPSVGGETTSEPSGETTGADTSTQASTSGDGNEPTSDATTQVDVTTADNSGSDESFTTVDTMLYTQKNVKARVKPNTSDDTDFTLVKAGTYVHVVGSGDKWYKVYLQNGSTGYIMKQYMGEEKPAETTSEAG